MEKENRNPNKTNSHLNKSINAPGHHHPSSTLDPKYHPKYIKKHDNMQASHLNSGHSLITLQESVQRNEPTYMHSPTSITENNTMDLERYRMKNAWKEECELVKHEMNERTVKFERSIGAFYDILSEMKKTINDPRL